MTTPAIFPAAMIAMVALAATHGRRDRASALWIGMAAGFSAWALLPAAAIFATATRRGGLATTVPLSALTMSGTSLALGALGLPHGLELIPAALLGLIGSVGSIWLRLRQSRPAFFTRRLALLSE
jgi:hypothetical protein